MVARLEKSKFGEGTGGACNVVGDSNAPSFDAASHVTKTDDKIRVLLSESFIARLSDWEKDFVMNCYGVAPLSRNQHIRVSKIYKTHVIESKPR